MKDTRFQSRMSVDTRANLDMLAKYYNLTASAVVDMLIERETRAIERIKEGERMDNNTRCGCIYENIDDIT